MKRYEFRAVTTGKQELIIGFAFAAILIFPILAIKLGLFYSGLDKILKSNPSALFKIGFLFAVMAIVYVPFYFIRKLQERLAKNYIVEIDGTNIRIFEDEKEIIVGSISDCKIINKIRGIPANSVTITIYTGTDRITFKCRGEKWKSIMGNSQSNPLGTSDVSDMETALTLGKDIKDILENPHFQNND